MVNNIDRIKEKLQWLRLNRMSIELEHVLKESTQKKCLFSCFPGKTS